MKWMLPLLVCACADKDHPCADGYGTDDLGRCVLIEEPDVEPDTGEVAINTPPTAPGVGVTPLSPRASGAPLNCIIVNASVDLDGDPVVYTFSWASAAGDTADGPTVDGALLIEGAV